MNDISITKIGILIKNSNLEDKEQLLEEFDFTCDVKTAYDFLSMVYEQWFRIHIKDNGIKSEEIDRLTQENSKYMSEFINWLDETHEAIDKKEHEGKEVKLSSTDAKNKNYQKILHKLNEAEKTVQIHESIKGDLYFDTVKLEQTVADMTKAYKHDKINGTWLSVALNKKIWEHDHAVEVGDKFNDFQDRDWHVWLFQLYRKFWHEYNDYVMSNWTDDMRLYYLENTK